MPLFEFSCQKCGQTFEEILSLAELEDLHLPCPACGSQKIEKGFSTFNTGSSLSGASVRTCPQADRCSGAGSGFS